MTSVAATRWLWAGVMVCGLCLLVGRGLKGDEAEKGSTIAEKSGGETAAERGWKALRTKAFLPADFDEATFDQLWTVWPEDEQERVKGLSREERRRATYSYYGLMRAEDDPDGPPLGHLATPAGWVMNCLTCHAGKVAGRVIPGLGNSHLALQSLVEDSRLVKVREKKPFSHLEKAALTIPMSQSDGTSNAVIFGVVLGALRNRDMTVDLTRKVPALVHHDTDPPPFWGLKKKKHLYWDGFAPRAHRPLMQFVLLPSATPERLTSWESDFRDILAWMESVEAPKYEGKIDEILAAKGEIAFEERCARCHGTYGKEGKYPEKVVAIQEVGTDRVRLDALTPEHREWMKQGWLSRYGEDEVAVNPGGYVAPPLDGLWASAPYFHNGSVPTLWHVLRPEKRPTVWKRTEDGYDHERMGLEVEEMKELPADADTAGRRRRYFDTRILGKSAVGHEFGNELSEEERRAVLEYLKTL